MKISEAMQILDPECGEKEKDPEKISIAQRMGAVALEKRLPQLPYPDGDRFILACPCCGSGEYLVNWDGNRNTYCGQCGQKIDWRGEDEP